LFAAFAAAIALTYARLEPEALYHTSEDGLAGGLGRALVFANFPTSLAAIAVLAVVVDRLGVEARRPWVVGVAVVALVLCLVTAMPGVVDQDDLDARPVNALAGLGVLLVAALAFLAVRRRGVGRLGPRRPGDLARLGVAAALVVLAIPWILADLGFYVGDVPILGSVFMSDELLPDGDGGVIRAVHLGDHHGTDGVLLALTALALSRVVPSLRSRGLAVALGSYLALMLVYGVANAAQDAWLEQIVKRGWTSRRIPDVLVPEATWAWLVLLVSALASYALLFGRRSSARSERIL
jgi:hypothetical protein